MAENSFVKRMRSFFGFGVKTNEVGKVQIDPVEKPSKQRRGGAPVTLDSGVRKLWDWYVKENNDSFSTLKGRFERYADLDYMYYNDTIFSLAVDLYADETAQSDVQFNLIEVKARNAKIQKEIQNLLDRWGVDQSYIRDVAFNLALYGDSFDVIDYNEKEGITSLTPVDVKDVTERVEFKYSEISKRMNLEKNRWMKNNDSLVTYLKKLDQDKTGGASSNYLSYLLGYIINKKDYVHPWQINHYRLEARKSEFWPYGRPLFIHLIGPFRQLKTAKNLMALTRAMKFPKEIYEVQTSDEMDAIEKWEAVNEARTEYSNIGRLNKTKDEFSVGDEIWLPHGLLTHRTESNDLRIESIADINLLRDDFIMGTFVPKGYLIVDQGNWGNSGQALLQQSKAFARKVYLIQSTILENISHILRLHFLMTGQFEKEYTEFQLSLNYPVVEEASDRMRMKRDSLNFAKDIINSVKDALGVRENPPKDIVKKIFAMYTFLDSDEVNELIDALSGEESVPDSEEETEALREKYLDRVSEDVIHEVAFDMMKKHSFKEYVKDGRHYYRSAVDTIALQHLNVYEFLRDSYQRNRIKS